MRFSILLLIAIVCFNLDYRYKTFTTFKKLLEVPRYYLINTVSFPFECYRDILTYVISHKNLIQENIYLKQLANIQSANLQKLEMLELENIRLKKLLHFTGSQKNVFGLANIIDIYTDPFKHQLTLNRGMNHGTYVGQTIMNAEGVLGSIISVEKKTSIAILITDISYAIPVLNLRNGLRAIALGSGDVKELTLQHVPNTADIKEQDVFVTSGIGGKYPAGYVVGTVSKVKKEVNFPFASISLTVAAKLDSCQEVLLIYLHKNTIEKQ